MYGADFMEYDGDGRSSSVISQSPATMSAQLDTAFVLKHNATADIYQVKTFLYN
jgi:hypothetical protein